MKKAILILLLLITNWCFASTSDSVQSTNRYVWHENILELRGGHHFLQDAYLSPLIYKGYSVGLQNEWWQHFSKSDYWGHVGKLSITGLFTSNSARSNSIYGVGISGGWGAYSYLIKKNWEFRIGPYLNIDFMNRYQVKNTNKPYSIDLGADLDLMFNVAYSFGGPKTSYRLRYNAHLNVLGCEFATDYWQSYYELQEGINKNNVALTYLVGKIFLRHELTFDMQFPHSTWRVGLQHEYLSYSQSNLSYQREQVGLVIGTIFNYKMQPAAKLNNFDLQ